MSDRLLEVLVYNLYTATLVGNPAPKVRALYERMTAPRVGDLVMELSTIHYPERAGTRMGRLTRVAEEPVYTPEAWAANGGGDDPIPLERAWYLALPDGREFRWVNAEFITVPTMLATYRAPFVSDGDALATPTPPEAP